MDSTDPVIKKGQHDWCKGAVDIGGVTLGDDGLYYAPVVGGRFSEGECEDTFACGIARVKAMTSWELRRNTILDPHHHPDVECPDGHAHGRRNGISYPQILKIGSWWYLYFVVENANFDGSGEFQSNVPNPRESHARLKLQWK